MRQRQKQKEEQRHEAKARGGRDKSREREVQGQLSALLGESRSRDNDDVCHFDSCKSNTKQGFMRRSRLKKSR